jgi:hypothetical protein
MPLQGVFNADFTAFTAACAAAETSLKGFETGASKTETALNRMADSISGTKIVQQAMLATKAVEDVGGAATLTEKELARMSDMAAQGAEKLQRMGQTVPPQMQALADATKATSDNTSTWNSVLTTLEGTFGALTLQRVIDQLIELGKAVFDDADKLTNLQDRTAIGVETLQRLRIVGDDAGVSLDTMANAASKLQKNLGQGSESTAAALAQIGLQFADLKKMSPEDQFYAVADALKKVDDQDTQVALGVQLMGKNFTELLPAIKKGFDEVKDSSAGMSAGTIKILDDLGDSAKRTYQNVKDYLGERLADTLTGTTEELRRLAGEFANLEKLAQPAAEKMANFWGQILPPSVPKDLQEITDKSDALAKESKAVAEAMVELDSAGKGWQGTLNTIDGTVVEAVKWYLEAGVSQGKLATAFGLTDAQVKAVDSSMKAYTETLKAVQKIEGDHAKQAETNYLGLSKAENDYTQKRLENEGKAADQLIAIDKRLTDEYNKQTMSRGEYESQKLWEAADAQIAAFQKTGATAEQVTQFSNKVYEETALKATEIDYAAGQTITDITNKAVEGVQKMAAAGAAALETLQGGEKLPGSTTEQAFGQNYLVSPTGARVPLGPHGEIPKNFDALYSGKSSFPQFAGGVQNFSGGLAVVGERGPELVNLPSGSDVIPNSRMGGGGVSITIHVTQPFGTPEAIARAVADAQVSLMRGQGVRLPYGT